MKQLNQWVDIEERHILTILRKEKQISQQEIAEEVGISQVALSKYETGKNGLRENNFKIYKDYIMNYEG